MIKILPFGSLVLIVLSFYVLLQNIKHKKRSPIVLYGLLTFNGFMFLLISTLIVLLYKSPDIITKISPVVYWIFIGVGLVIGLLSSIRIFIPGQLTSISILFCMTIITIFSIGIVLYILALIQFVLVWNHTRRFGLTNY